MIAVASQFADTAKSGAVAQPTLRQASIERVDWDACRLPELLRRKWRQRRRLEFLRDSSAGVLTPAVLITDRNRLQLKPGGRERQLAPSLLVGFKNQRRLIHQIGHDRLPQTALDCEEECRVQDRGNWQDDAVKHAMIVEEGIALDR